MGAQDFGFVLAKIGIDQCRQESISPQVANATNGDAVVCCTNQVAGRVCVVAGIASQLLERRTRYSSEVPNLLRLLFFPVLIAFACLRSGLYGAMHNFSYVGGLIGDFTGLASILRSFLQENESLSG